MTTVQTYGTLTYENIIFLITEKVSVTTSLPDSMVPVKNSRSSLLPLRNSRVSMQNTANGHVSIPPIIIENHTVYD